MLTAVIKVTIGALSNAAIHLEGLRLLVDLKGGVRQLNGDLLLSSLVTW